MRMHEQIGEFVLLDLLGRGARSQVWRARDAGGTEVALKLAPLADPLACARLAHEWAIVGRLAHPHVAGARGHGSGGGHAWLALELLAPATLTLDRLRDLLAALAYVHGRGVVHCDVKPANLLRDASGRLKLADFGIARMAGAALQGVPAHGTPCYMAPEQLRGQQVDARSDVFAAGVLLYQLVAGRPPFTGSAFEVMQQILDGDGAPPTGTAYQPVIEQALARDPARRLASAAAFLNAIDAIVNRENPQLS